MRFRPSLFTVAIALALIAPAAAQDNTEKELERYRQMLKDDPWSNPGLLDADRGEALWQEKRGPKTASLEQCDLDQDCCAPPKGLCRAAGRGAYRSARKTRHP